MAAREVKRGRRRGHRDCRKKLAKNPAFINQCWLMKSGVPFSIIFPGLTGLMPHERIAMGVVMRQFDGGVYNWNTGQWEEGN